MRFKTRGGRRKKMPRTGAVVQVAAAARPCPPGGGACVIVPRQTSHRENAAARTPRASPAGAARLFGMGVLQGLLNKLGLESLLTARAPLRVFLLDDDTLRHEWFARALKGDYLDVAADAARAVELLAANTYDLVFLDHDLLPEHYYAEQFDDERSGYAVARFLAERPDRQPVSAIIVHTRNADGALRMIELMRRAGRQAEHIPFHMLAPRIKNLRKRG